MSDYSFIVTDMSVKKDFSNRILTWTSTHQVGGGQPESLDIYQLPPELPADARKRDICFQHVAAGVPNELAREFDEVGAHFPEVGEPQEMTVQFSCKGVGCILKTCGLTITQYDANGRMVSDMRASNQDDA